MSVEEFVVGLMIAYIVLVLIWIIWLNFTKKGLKYLIKHYNRDIEKSNRKIDKIVDKLERKYGE